MTQETPFETPFTVIYEDNHLCVVDKRAGLATQPHVGSTISLEEEVARWLAHTHHKPGAAFARVAHRLDTPVSGLVILAKTSKALARLHAAFREGHVEKGYLALVEALPCPQTGTLCDRIVHGDGRAEIDPIHGKEAHLTYALLGQEPSGLYRLQITPTTGRYHQIRIQLAHAGWPIVGDLKYGSTISWAGTLALHCHCITLPHPIGGAPITFTAAPPW